METSKYSESLSSLAESADKVRAGRAKITRCLLLLHGEFEEVRRNAEASHGDRGASLVTCTFSLPDGFRLQVRPLYALHMYCDETFGLKYTTEGFDGASLNDGSALFGKRIYGIAESDGKVSFKCSVPQAKSNLLPGLEVLYDFISQATRREVERASRYNGD